MKNDVASMKVVLLTNFVQVDKTMEPSSYQIKRTVLHVLVGDVIIDDCKDFVGNGWVARVD